jgi:protein arginine phosphatase
VSQTTVVLVCTGNTCRSPLAMVLARQLWPDTVTVDSAGLQAQAGEPAALPARAVAQEWHTDLTAHRARRLDQRELVRPGWIIGLTRSHVAMLARTLDPHGPVRLGLLGAPGVDLRGAATPDVDEVSDPIGGDLERYRATARQLERMLKSWTPFVGEDNQADRQEPEAGS